jgi:hypothetical protein
MFHFMLYPIRHSGFFRQGHLLATNGKFVKELMLSASYLNNYPFAVLKA